MPEMWVSLGMGSEQQIHGTNPTTLQGPLVPQRLRCLASMHFGRVCSNSATWKEKISSSNTGMPMESVIDFLLLLLNLSSARLMLLLRVLRLRLKRPRMRPRQFPLFSLRLVIRLGVDSSSPSPDRVATSQDSPSFRQSWVAKGWSYSRRPSQNHTSGVYLEHHESWILICRSLGV